MLTVQAAEAAVFVSAMMFSFHRVMCGSVGDAPPRAVLITARSISESAATRREWWWWGGHLSTGPRPYAGAGSLRDAALFDGTR